MNKILKIAGMSCGHCTGTVRKALQAVAGVDSVNVDLDSGTASVTVADDVTEAALAAAVNDTGFEVVGIE